MSETKTGTFVWNELMTRDVPAAKDFYTRLLGWEAIEWPMGDFTYTVFRSGEKDVGGMMPISKEMGDVPPHWMSYIEVEDVDASAKKVEELGGKIVFPPTDIPDVGRLTTITDPTGAYISLFKGLKK